MDSIFSDDEEFDAFRDNLFEGNTDEQDENMVPMFGMYAVVKKEKPREDIFLRALEPPTNDSDPYKQDDIQIRKPVLKRTNLCDNFSFFGMKQGKVRMEEKTSTNHAAERKKMLERLNVEQQSDNDENEEPVTPRRRSVRMSAKRKRKRVEVSSSESSDESESESPNCTHSPQPKRISPT